MNNMIETKEEHSEIPEDFKTKIEKRDKKRKPKMKISGKRVFQLKKLLKNSPR